MRRRCTTADRVWCIKEIIEMMDAAAPKPCRPKTSDVTIKDPSAMTLNKTRRPCFTTYLHRAGSIYSAPRSNAYAPNSLTLDRSSRAFAVSDPFR